MPKNNAPLLAEFFAFRKQWGVIILKVLQTSENKEAR